MNLIKADFRNPLQAVLAICAIIISVISITLMLNCSPDLLKDITNTSDPQYTGDYRFDLQDSLNCAIFNTWKSGVKISTAFVKTDSGDFHYPTGFGKDTFQSIVMDIADTSLIPFGYIQIDSKTGIMDVTPVHTGEGYLHFTATTPNGTTFRDSIYITMEHINSINESYVDTGSFTDDICDTALAIYGRTWSFRMDPMYDTACRIIWDDGNFRDTLTKTEVFSPMTYSKTPYMVYSVALYNGFFSPTCSMTVVPRLIELNGPEITVLNKPSATYAYDTMSVIIRVKDASGIDTVYVRDAFNSYTPAHRENDSTYTAARVAFSSFGDAVFTVYAKDTLGNISTLKDTFSVDVTLQDNVAPTITASALPSRVSDDSNTTIVTVTDANGVDSVIFTVLPKGHQGMLFPRYWGVAKKLTGNQYQIDYKVVYYGIDSLIIKALDGSANHNEGTRVLWTDYNTVPTNITQVAPAPDAAGIPCGTDPGTVLTWLSGLDPDGDSLSYMVKIGESVDAMDTIETKTSPLTIYNLKENTKYYWYVITMSGPDAIRFPAAADVYYNFTTADKTPPAVSIISPADNVRTVDGAVSILLDVTDANGVDSVWATAGGVNTKGSLVSGKRYRINLALTSYGIDTIVVSARDKSSEKNVSSQNLIAVYNTSLGGTISAVPADGAIGVENPTAGVALSWSGARDPDGDAVRYVVYHGTSTSALSSVSSTARTVNVSGYGSNVTVYWYLKAISGVDTVRYPSAAGAFLSFVTVDAYGPSMSLVSPTTNIRTKDGAVQILADITDPNGIDSVWATVNSGVRIYGSKVSGNRYKIDLQLTSYDTNTLVISARDKSTAMNVSSQAIKSIYNTPLLGVTDASPEDAAIGVGNPVTLSWSGASDLDGDQIRYLVYYGTSTSALSLVETQEQSMTLNGLPTNTMIFWFIASIAGADTVRYPLAEATYSAFTTADVDAPTISLAGPASGTRFSSDSATIIFTATDANGIDKAWIVVAGGETDTVPLVSGQYTKKVKLVNYGPNSITLFARDASTNNNVGQTSLNVVFNTVPTGITSVTPVTGAVEVSNLTGTQLSWSGDADLDGDARKYVVHYGTSTSAMSEANATAQTVTLPGLTDFSKYNWYVDVISGGDTLRCPQASNAYYDFTTADMSAPVISITAPVNGARTTNGNSTFNFTITHSSGVDSVWYTIGGVWKGKVSPQGSGVPYTVTIPTTLYHSNTIAIWARAKTVAKKTANASITVDYNTPATAITTVTPANNATGVVNSSALSWNACTDADGDGIKYQVWFGTAVSNLTMMTTAAGQSGTTYAPTTIGLTDYYWQVKVLSGTDVITYPTTGAYKYTTIDRAATITGLPTTYTATINDVVTLNATVTDPDGTPCTYSWDTTGAGAWKSTGTTPSVSFKTKSTVSTYNVILRATDPKGGTTTKSVAFTVKNGVPSSILPSTLSYNYGATASLNLGSYFTDDGTGITYSSSYNGATQTTPVIMINTNIIPLPQTNNLIVNALDEDGNVKKDTIIITTGFVCDSSGIFNQFKYASGISGGYFGRGINTSAGFGDKVLIKSTDLKTWTPVKTYSAGFSVKSIVYVLGSGTVGDKYYMSKPNSSEQNDSLFLMSALGIIGGGWVSSLPNSMTANFTNGTPAFETCNNSVYIIGGAYIKDPRLPSQTWHYNDSIYQLNTSTKKWKKVATIEASQETTSAFSDSLGLVVITGRNKSKVSVFSPDMILVKEVLLPEALSKTAITKKGTSIYIWSLQGLYVIDGVTWAVKKVISPSKSMGGASSIAFLGTNLYVGSLSPARLNKVMCPW